MDDREFLAYLLAMEEWQKFECKRAVTKPSKVLETIVAFMNTEGGLLVLGLDDPHKTVGHNRFIGVSGAPSHIAEVIHLAKTEISPAFGDVRHFQIPICNIQGNSDFLSIFMVGKSNDVHSLRSGDTFVRRGDRTVKIGSLEITRLKYEKGAVKFEDELSSTKGLDVLDQKLLAQFRRDVRSASEDIWQFLCDNRLAGGKNGNRQLTKGGLLLFAKNPAVALSKKCSIKISHYHGTDPSFTGEPNFVRRPFTVEGPLLRQIEKTVKYFDEIVHSSPPKLKGATFSPSFIIPSWVFQEAVTNAVIHRNYAIENDIQVRFFSDRVEIESPGTYPGHITIANIRRERFARNPMILRILNRFSMAPNLDTGEGVDRMFAVMHEANLYEPFYVPPKVKPNSVLVVLWNIQRVEYWDIVSAYLEKEGRISNARACKITGVKDTLKMSRLLKGWREKGLIEKIGHSKRMTFYVKPGYEVSKKLFS